MSGIGGEEVKGSITGVLGTGGSGKRRGRNWSNLRIVIRTVVSYAPKEIHSQGPITSPDRRAKSL